MHIIKYDLAVKCGSSHNCHFTSGIQTFNICCRIRFCITKLRCFGKGFLKTHPQLKHFRQNIVRRTIDNTGNLCNLITGQTLTKRTHNRDSASYCCLKHQIHMMCCCNLQQIFTTYCQQILISSYYILAGFQRFCDDRLCGFNTAHYFNYNVNLFIFYNVFPLIRQQTFINAFTLFIPVVNQNLSNLHICSGLADHLTLLSLDQFVDTSAYCSKSK